MRVSNVYAYVCLFVLLSIDPKPGSSLHHTNPRCFPARLRSLSLVSSTLSISLQSLFAPQRPSCPRPPRCLSRPPLDAPSARSASPLLLYAVRHARSFLLGLRTPSIVRGSRSTRRAVLTLTTPLAVRPVVTAGWLFGAVGAVVL